MQISELMTREPVVVHADAPLDVALALFDEHRFRHLPVADGGRLVGMLSDRDLMLATGWQRLAARRPDETADPDYRPAAVVREVMRSPVKSLSPEDSVVTACWTMIERTIGALPVVAEGRVVGIVTETDVLRAYLRACEQRAGEPGLDPQVSAAMSRDPVTLDRADVLSDAIERSLAQGCRHLPVLDGGRLVGIVSDRDVREAVGVQLVVDSFEPDPPDGALDTPVVEIMTAKPATAAPHTTLSQVARTLVEGRFGALPVVEQGRLVGIVTQTDVLEHCMNTLRATDPGA